MDVPAGARKLVGELVKARQIEVRRAEIVGRDLAQWIESQGHAPSGVELESWLGDHAQVTELYAPRSLLDELVERHLTEPVAVKISDDDVRHPELEAQLADDVEPYAIYADFLQERGDPLGEWIALGILADKGGAQDIARFESYRKRHDVRLFGGLGSRLSGVTLEWRFGMVRAINGIGDKQAWEELLGLRVCSALQAITVQGAPKNLAATIAQKAAPTLRAVTVQHAYNEDLTALFSRELRELTVTGLYSTLRGGFPKTLERLVWQVQTTEIANRVQLDIEELRIELHADAAKLLRLLDLPYLERLELEIEKLPLRDLPTLIGEIQAPVTHLVLCEGRLDPATFAAIAALPIAHRITKLGLPSLELTDEMIAAMAPGDFANLTEIDVSFNELTRVGLAHAKRFATTVISTRQHKRGNGMEQRTRRFAGSRLQAAELIADPKHWKRSGLDGDLRWGRYSGEADYELYISKDLSRFGCSCPSSIQPCKHVVALALVDERTPLRKLPVEYGLVDRVGAARDPSDTYE
jgi:uncharacterized protein (TIGR02996 family)